MKLLLILWALGLSAGDKLDRTYLPPSGSKAAGGRAEDLDLPLEFPKENYPSSLDPRVDELFDSSLKPNYPNVAVGIERQGPYIESSDTTETGVPFSKNIYIVPSTTPYALAQTTTLAPSNGYDNIDKFISNQDYPATKLSFGSNLNGQQIMTPQSFNVDGVHGINKDFGTGSPDYGSQATNDGSFLRYSNGSSSFSTNIHQAQTNPDGSLKSEPVFPKDQASNFGRPVSFSSNPQGVNRFDNERGATISPASPSYTDNLRKYKFQPDTQNNMEILKYSTPPHFDNIDTTNTDLYSPAKAALSTISPPSMYTEASTESVPTDAKLSKYGLTPTTSLRGNYSPHYNTDDRPERVLAESDRKAVILNYENLLTSDGFAYNYDTSNGIHADESGTAVNGVRAQGSYSYIGDDGKTYRVTYTADENGFLPRGDHLPTVPPIPDAILKVIEQAEKDKQLGVIDDGSYDDLKYGHERYQGFMGRKPQNHKKYNILEKRPTNSLLAIENTPYENYEPDSGRKNLQYAGKTTILSKRPYDDVVIINRNNFYNSDGIKQFVPTNKYDGVQPVYPTDGKLVNKEFPYGTVNESTGSFQSYHRPSMPQTQYYVDNNPKTLTTSTSVIEEEYGENQPSQRGYDYNPPQSVYQQKEGNNFQPFLRNSNSESSDELLSDKPVRKLLYKQAGDQTLSYRGSGIIKPNKEHNESIYTDLNPKIPTYNNEKSYDDENGEVKIADNTLSTPKSVYGSTTAGPYHHASEIPNGEKQQHNYPSFASKPKYSSTTSLPSEFFTQSTLIANDFGYSYTTPIPYQFTSSLRPSFGSVTSETKEGLKELSVTRRPGFTIGYTSSQGPLTTIRTSTARPGNINRTNGRFGYRGRPTVTSSDRKELIQHNPQRNDEMKPRFDGFDNNEQNLRVRSRPKNVEEELISERVIVEDFIGPKQPQRFDPEHGYYY